MNPLTLGDFDAFFQELHGLGAIRLANPSCSASRSRIVAGGRSTFRPGAGRPHAWTSRYLRLLARLLGKVPTHFLSSRSFIVSIVG